jgi:hypothetical protein
VPKIVLLSLLCYRTALNPNAQNQVRCFWPTVDITVLLACVMLSKATKTKYLCNYIKSKITGQPNFDFDIHRWMDRGLFGFGLGECLSMAFE